MHLRFCPVRIKAEIKLAVELVFNVKVENVCLMNVKGKAKRFKQVEGRRNDWKKAYVTLAAGSEITYEGAE